MSSRREIASGLLFPEGPIALEDGSALLVEIKRGTLARRIHHALGHGGRLVAMPWKTPGLRLAF